MPSSIPRQLDHVAFVVRSLDEALAALGAPDELRGPCEHFESEGTIECYVGRAQQSARLLLIEPAPGDGPYARALERRGPGLHHVALRVGDLDRFLADDVAHSGWLLHPRSLATRRSSGTIWLARPGVEVLVECFEGEVVDGAPTYVEEVTIAGLNTQASLAALFYGCGVPVASGARSGARIDGSRFSHFEPTGLSLSAMEDVAEYNREAWNAAARAGDRWTVGVSADEVAAARTAGEASILLTPSRVVPQEWLSPLEGKDVLCLASGGGQQGPLLAAAGANVTVFDASDEQLLRDREVAAREGLEVRTVRGDMRDLSAFGDATFDLVVHPCSNVFVAEIAPVWRETFRVLRPGGELLSGFTNPVLYCFDWGSVKRGSPKLRYPLPYCDLDRVDDDPFVARLVAAGEPVAFSHTLDAQLGGQLEVGFVIVGFYEDGWGEGAKQPFPDPYFPGFLATRARKPT